ncbi:phage terminase large subunit [Geminicoccaceae bacterium 1502E]|nr:phage terminase large subunit [Geminicoccaceae bacterium 1502E]
MMRKGRKAPAGGPDPGPAGIAPAAASFGDFIGAWNELQGWRTPALHRRIGRWLEDRWRGGDTRLLLMVFRNAGKSTLVGLFCAWLLSRNPELRILVLAAEHELARKMTRTVRGIIERHPMTRELLPERLEEWASDRLTVRRARVERDPSLLARGLGANITGTRADIVVCDDVEVPNTADTPGKRAELRERLAETGFILVPGGTQLYVGTPHSYYSIYADEARGELEETTPFLDGFDRLVIPVRENGASVWPERFDEAAIDRIARETGPHRFKSQMMLVPTHMRDVRLDPDRLQRYDGPLEIREANGETVLSLAGRRMRRASAWWDPALGRPEKGDGSVVAVVYLDDDGNCFLHRLRYLVTAPDRLDGADEATFMCREVVALARELELPSITVESNGLGALLPGLLRQAVNDARLDTAVVAKSSSVPKERRILEALDPVLAARRLHVHESVWQSPFIREMREWSPGRSGGTDDALDAVAACIAAEPVHLRQSPRAAPRSTRPGAATPHQARTEFDPLAAKATDV